jgi:hypothetical protein
VPHVRTSVQGTKTMGEAQQSLLKSVPTTNHRVPQIPDSEQRSIVFREMWDTTTISLPRLMWLGRIQKRLLGFAHRFRPTYAQANVGHPSDFLIPRC